MESSFVALALPVIILCQLVDQRLWEKEIIEKEHAFQKEQMQSFVQAMQAIGSQASPSNYGMPQNLFMPQNYGISTNYKLPQNVKIIPMNENNINGSSQINTRTPTASTSASVITEENNDSSKA